MLAVKQQNIKMYAEDYSVIFQFNYQVRHRCYTNAIQDALNQML